MPEYLIAFYEEWVPELTEDELMDRARVLKPLLAEMEAAGVWVFGGGLDQDAPVFGVDLVGGKPVTTDGPYAETKEHLGGFCVVRVADEAEAQRWAEKVAVGCGWPQQVHRFMPPPEV
jgi:hypothetical protein